MQRSASTVVCLVGSVPDAVQAVLGSHTAYSLHDDDPLGAVADAWTRLFEESGPIGELDAVEHHAPELVVPAVETERPGLLTPRG